MEKIENPLVGYRVKLLRELLLLRVEEVSFLTKIPVTNLRRMEEGEISSVEELGKLSELYQVKREVILNTEIQLPTWKELRRKGLKLHRNDEYYIKAINKEPRPKKAVEFRLLMSDFLTSYQTVAESVIKLKAMYRWNYDEPRIDYAFNVLVNDGVLEKLEQVGVPNKYRKSRATPTKNRLVHDRIITELEDITSEYIGDSLTPAYHKMAGMLYVLRKGAKKGQDLFNMVLYSYSPKNIDRSLKILRNLDLIELTEAEINSSKQKYRLTKRGAELVNQFVIGSEE